MNNYFQKIASRSGANAGESHQQVPFILPQQPLSFYESQNDLIKENDPQTDFVNNPIQGADTAASMKQEQKEDASSIKYQPQKRQEAKQAVLPVSNQTKYIQPAPAEISALKEKDSNNNNAGEEARKEPGTMQPTITIFEKISQRNTQSTIITKQNTVPGQMPVTNGNAERFYPLMPDKEINQPVKNENSKEKRLLPEITPPDKFMQPQPPLQKMKEFMLPVQAEHLVVPTPKITQENKLVIGRITVEVINPVQTTIKTREPLRQNNANKVSSTIASGINKLSFGLGQL